MTNILLTGGSGFIGRNILESGLSSSYNIKAPGHSELELMDENSVGDYIKNNKIDVIIHAAAKPGHRNAGDPAGIFYTNTRIFFNLARKADCYDKMIIIGSGAVYDMRYYRPKMKEEYFGRHVPLDEHGFSKYVIGKYIEKTRGITDLRVFGIFGKYEDYSIRFISNMICKSLYGLPLTMKQNRLFDYIYVKDLFPVLDYFITHDTGFREYNVTPDSSIELKKIAGMVRDISGRKELAIVIAADGLGPEYSGDNSRLKKEIPGVKFTPIEDSIGDLYSWYAGNTDRINKELLLMDK
jgi:GDP-L-fucose synthase